MGTCEGCGMLVHLCDLRSWGAGEGFACEECRKAWAKFSGEILLRETIR